MWFQIREKKFCCDILFFKKEYFGAEEMTHWLKALAAPPENMGLISSTHMMVHSSSRRLNTL